MGYLDSSYDALKGYCTSGYTILSEQFNQYYPIIREGAVKYGKPLVTSIHSKALEYPMAALISANVILIFLAKKITAFASGLLNKLTFGILPKKLTAPIMAISIIGAGNYGIYNYASLNLSLEAALIVPALTFAAVMLLNRIRNPPLTKVQKEAQEHRIRITAQLAEAEKKMNELKNNISQQARSLTPDQKKEIVKQFAWWKPEESCSLDLRTEAALDALLKVIKNSLSRIVEKNNDVLQSA